MKYLSLLKSVKTISLETVGGAEWGFFNGRHWISPVIIKSFRDAKLIENSEQPNQAVLTDKAKKLLSTIN